MHPSGMHSYYRPQRSWGKVLFLQVCVILFTGGTPPGTRYTPRDQVHPPGPGIPPQDQVPPGQGTPPGAEHAGGTHPTGMQFCNSYVSILAHLA